MLHRAVFSAALAVAITSSIVKGQDYSARPVRIIVGFGAGAVADTPARLLAQKFSQSFGQQFVVENKPAPAAASRPSTCHAPARTATRCSWPLRPTPSTSPQPALASTSP